MVGDTPFTEALAALAGIIRAATITPKPQETAPMDFDQILDGYRDQPTP